MRIIGLVLAAGRGKRFGSVVPKVFHPLFGRKMMEYALRALTDAGIEDTYVVTQKAFTEHLGGVTERLLFQREPSGTGDAVLTARGKFGNERAILVVLNGDAPLFTPHTVSRFLEFHIKKGAFCSFAAAEVRDPTGYGRVKLKNGAFARLLEESRLTPREQKIRLINAGLYAFESPEILDWLSHIPIRRERGERYLTDVFNLAVQRGRRVGVFLDFPKEEAIGVNTPAHFAEVISVLKQRICERHLRNGVIIEDASTAWIDDTVEIEPETRLRPYVVVEGPSIIRSGAVIGPFAHIRPHTIVESGAHIGNFVEIKNSHIGEGVHAEHLSYIGDAEVGHRTNIGAGTITCNFDGVRKHRTIIGEDVFVGSDTILVAPLKLGNRSVTGAGSVITRDLPEDALGVERATMRIVRGYRKRKHEKQKGS